MGVKIDGFHEAPNSGGTYPKVLLVVHVTISPEVADAALGVIRNWNITKSGSTQYVVDNEHIQQAVREQAYAWSAGTTANKWGIHVEHVGFMQTVRQWLDGYSTAELELSAGLFAELGAKWGIPLRRLTVDQIRHAVQTGKAADGGICSHADITEAFPGETTHTDTFPEAIWGKWLDMVHAAGQAAAQPTAHEAAGLTEVEKARQHLDDAVHSLWVASNRLGKADGRPKAQAQIGDIQTARKAAKAVLEQLPKK